MLSCIFKPHGLLFNPFWHPLECHADPQPIVRVCAADALSECLAILMERQRRSMTAPLCTLFAHMMEGLEYTASDAGPQPRGDSAAFAAISAVRAHGSLLVASEILRHSGNFILPRFDELCVAVLKFAEHPLVLIRLEVLRLVPRLAKRCPEIYGRRYLQPSLEFLIASIAGTKASPSAKSRIDARPTAFTSIGQLALAMSDEKAGGGDIMVPSVRILSNPCPLDEEVGEDFDYHTVELKDESDFQESLGDIFHLISDNLKRGGNVNKSGAVISRCDVLGCFANFVEALGVHAAPYVMGIVEDMFDSGLSEDLIECLHSVARSVPSAQLGIERRLFEEISFCLAGTTTIDLFSTKRSHGRPALLPVDPELSSVISSVNSSSSLVNQHLQQPATLERNFMSSMSLSSMNPGIRPKKPPQSELETVVQDVTTSTRSRIDSSITAATNNHISSHKNRDHIVINTSTRLEVVEKLVLSLRTLRTIGESYMRVTDLEDGNMLLPFLRDVISMYFAHPSSDVRREAATTCCLLLLPFRGSTLEEEKKIRFKLGNVGSHVEEILQKLLRMAVSDLSPVVRLCIVRGLDERYDGYLSLLDLVAPLFLALEDEALAVRASALQILGRVSRINPAATLPRLRRVLIDLIVELQCGGDDFRGGREMATRLIVIFLREEALQRLTRPLVSSIIAALPLAGVAPRLATASLEALGELAAVAHDDSIDPWLRERLISHSKSELLCIQTASLISFLISHESLKPFPVLENVQDQNSSQKQRVSLWALGKIAYGTGYVVRPYLDYPQLLTQAADILPTTKRASWDLRREVFRTFGILGALDPDRFGSTRKGGGKGGGYFVELEDEKGPGAAGGGARSSTMPTNNGSVKRMSDWDRNRSSMPLSSPQRNGASAHLEQFLAISTSAQKKQTQVPGGSRLKSIYRDPDNDEPAHLFMYEQYAMTAQPLSQLSPARRLSPSDEVFYPTVAVQALMRILKDSSLSNLHGMVMKVRRWKPHFMRVS
mmetsp:Transcript_15876/g.34202  ORF Transcript_15876/g.34202 Transcript_15876/m.34202 type:complete len:1004 (+) Transcript_15876:2382-5393(+)